MPDVWVKQSTCTLGRSLEDFLNAEGFLGLLNAEMLQVVLVETEECNKVSLLIVLEFPHRWFGHAFVACAPHRV